MRVVRPVLIASVVAVIAACNGSNVGTTATVDTNVYTADPATTPYAASLNVNIGSMLKTPSGLYYKDLATGTGATAGAGYTVRVGYGGYLVNGTQFDTSASFEFLLNAGKVVKGWDEGVQGMKVGGTRQLVIPPGLGYGTSGSGAIPGNAILVFGVTLLQVR
jgi:FKBP-type peptidyl-prolyl cis-trans isomerase